MIRMTALTAVLAVSLAACGGTPAAPPLLEGKPLPQRYDITEADRDVIQLRLLDGMNAIRQASGAAPVALNAELTAAAATHARDMSVQNRPWHFGSDGSSPLDRARRVGYGGRILGENISETYETELETLAAWMETPETREIITDARTRDIGFGWFQESNGKIWWTLLTGTQLERAIAQSASVAVAPPPGR